MNASCTAAMVGLLAATLQPAIGPRAPQLDLLLPEPVVAAQAGIVLPGAAPYADAVPPAAPPLWRAEDAPGDWPFVGLPPRAFRVIIADPPWAFRTYSHKGLKKSPQTHYACMDLDGIKALPVADLAHPEGCALALWATAPMLPQAIEVVAVWGFAYKTAGAWAKQSRTGKA